MKKTISLFLAVIMIIGMFTSVSFAEKENLNKLEKAKEKLEEYYEVLNGVNEDDYTVKSWSIYQSEVALNIVDENSTDKEIDKAIKNIIKAQKKLVKKLEAFGNEFEIGTTEEFETGEFFNTEAINSPGDGGIALKKIKGKYVSEGEYISDIINVPNFEYMVMSWNSDTPEGTQIEVQARVLVNHFVEDEEVQTWTDWFSWGIWSPHIARKSISRTDTLAKLDVDTLTIRGSKGETASKVQVKVILKTDDPSVTPVVRYLHGTLKNTINPILKEYEEEIDLTNLDINIETPALSQMIRDPRSRNSICSPTTVTMLLHRYGETHLLPDELAQNTYDNSYGFGNWSFAMATAGSYGYKAYIDFLNMEDLKREIYNGYPVGVSVRYRHIEDSTSPYPYVEGAPGTTAGHLIVVTGFTVIDGVEYVLVNDPFAPDNETTPRIYRLDQFDEAWSNRAAYIVREKEANAGKYPTMRLKAELVKTEIPNEYEVYYKGENINIYNFGGRLAYTIDNDETHGYFPKAAKNSLTISEEDIYNPNLKVYIITDLGKVYVARYYNGPK